MFSNTYILHIRNKLCSNVNTIHLSGSLKIRKTRVFCPCVQMRIFPQMFRVQRTSRAGQEVDQDRAKTNNVQVDLYIQKKRCSNLNTIHLSYRLKSRKNESFYAYSADSACSEAEQNWLKGRSVPGNNKCDVTDYAQSTRTKHPSNVISSRLQIFYVTIPDRS